jgi:hypothetical protein
MGFLGAAETSKEKNTAEKIRKKTKKRNLIIFRILSLNSFSVLRAKETENHKSSINCVVVPITFPELYDPTEQTEFF